MNRIKAFHLTPAARALAVAGLLGLSLGACAQSQAGMEDSAAMSSGGTTIVGGERMYPQKTIVENAVNSKDHKTLVAAVKHAGLVDTLSSDGPFTVFAPTDAAFHELPEGTVDSLMQRQNMKKLQSVLTYHVVPGKLTAEDLMQRIKANGGKATLKTASGGTLTAMMNGPMNVILHDEHGGTAHISTYDVMQANGVIHVVDQVLLPS